jgi:hypothetical protein
VPIGSLSHVQRPQVLGSPRGKLTHLRGRGPQGREEGCQVCALLTCLAYRPQGGTALSQEGQGLPDISGGWGSRLAGSIDARCVHVGLSHNIRKADSGAHTPKVGCQRNNVLIHWLNKCYPR